LAPHQVEQKKNKTYRSTKKVSNKIILFVWGGLISPQIPEELTGEKGRDMRVP